MLPESSQQPGVAGIIYTSYQFGEWPSERCVVGPVKALCVSFHMPSSISCSDNSSLMFGPFKEDGKKLVESRSCSNCLLSVNFFPRWRSHDEWLSTSAPSGQFLPMTSDILVIGGAMFTLSVLARTWLALASFLQSQRWYRKADFQGSPNYIWYHLRSSSSSELPLYDGQCI